MNANFFRELPDYGGGKKKKRGESWGITLTELLVVTRIHQSCFEWDLRPFRGAIGIKKGLIIAKYSENVFHIPSLNTLKEFPWIKSRDKIQRRRRAYFLCLSNFTILKDKKKAKNFILLNNKCLCLKIFEPLKILKLFKTKIAIKIQCFRNRAIRVNKIWLKMRNNINKYSLNVIIYS